MLPKNLRYVHQTNNNKYDKKIFNDFYNLLDSNFPNKDELEDIKIMEYFVNNTDKNIFYSTGHYLILLNENDAVVAGACLEYYPLSNCGLLSYSIIII
jgi:hypothetical protein